MTKIYFLITKSLNNKKKKHFDQPLSLSAFFKISVVTSVNCRNLIYIKTNPMSFWRSKNPFRLECRSPRPRGRGLVGLTSTWVHSRPHYGTAGRRSDWHLPLSPLAVCTRRSLGPLHLLSLLV